MSDEFAIIDVSNFCASIHKLGYTLPLGTSCHIDSSSYAANEQILIGLLSELEKQIFELKDRIKELERMTTLQQTNRGVVMA